MNKVANKMKVHYSSNSNEWATPDYIYKPLNSRFRFTLDPCCTVETAKCGKFFTIAEDGLKQNWGGERVFVNPPYGRQIGKWIEKSFIESEKPNTTVVMLIPARTDTKAWVDYCQCANEIIFIAGRVKFINKGQVKPASAPFPSAIVVFGKHAKDYMGPTVSWKKFVETA